jgi:hypothetical protein
MSAARAAVFASPVVSASLTIAGHKVDIGGQFHGSLSQTLDTSAGCLGHLEVAPPYSPNL